jgi:hypothetical protein
VRSKNSFSHANSQKPEERGEKKSAATSLCANVRVLRWLPEPFKEFAIWLRMITPKANYGRSKIIARALTSSCCWRASRLQIFEVATEQKK